VAGQATAFGTGLRDADFMVVAPYSAQVRRFVELAAASPAL